MIYELNHFGIVVKDLKKSLDFYQGVLGAKTVYQGLIPTTQTDVVYLQIAGGLIELLHRAEPAPDEKFGITHIAFMSDDLDADYARLVEAGHKEYVKPKVAGTGNGRLAFLADPNGARVELIQREGKMRLDANEHPIIKSFDHYSLTANDLDGAMRFYQTLMGMKTLKTMEVPARELSMVYLHWGYELRWLDAHHPWINTAFQHYVHHAKSTLNQPMHTGFFFKIWDRMAGSEYKAGPEECLCARCSIARGERSREAFAKIEKPDYSPLLSPSFWLTGKNKRSETEIAPAE